MSRRRRLERARRPVRRTVSAGEQLGGPVHERDLAVAEVREVLNAALDQAAVVDVDPEQARGIGRPPDEDVGDTALLERGDPLVAHPDLHHQHSVHAATAQHAPEGTVVVAPARGEEEVEIDRAGQLAQGRDERELRVDQARAGVRNHQAQGPAATLRERPRAGIRPVSELLHDTEDLLALLW